MSKRILYSEISRGPYVRDSEGRERPPPKVSVVLTKWANPHDDFDYVLVLTQKAWAAGDYQADGDPIEEQHAVLTDYSRPPHAPAIRLAIAQFDRLYKRHITPWTPDDPAPSPPNPTPKPV